MYINFMNNTDKDVSKEIKLIKCIFKHLKNKDDVFSIIFVSKEEIRQYNKDYRNKDAVTDVISFAYNDEEEGSMYSDNEIGDILICLDRASEQALEYGHSLEREVGFLAVHGYLHLCGYDHMTKEEEKIMFSKQEEILKKAGLGRE